VYQLRHHTTGQEARRLLSTGKAMSVPAQAVSHRLLSAEAQVHARVNTCEISRGKSGTGTGFISEFFCFSCQYNSTMDLHIHVSGGWTIGPLVAAVLRHSLTPSTWSTTGEAIGIRSLEVRTWQTLVLSETWNQSAFLHRNTQTERTMRNSCPSVYPHI
jgi:hypothetical protein